MPITIIDKDEVLTYTPDQQGAGMLTGELAEAVRTLTAEAAAVGVAIPPVLSVALLAQDRPDKAQDAVFEYRRLAGNVRVAIISRHTVNGITDFWAARWEMGKEALVGWRNVLDVEGQPVPFDRALVPMIPGSIVTDIGILVDEKSPETYLKNSVGTSNGTLPSPGSRAKAAARS